MNKRECVPALMAAVQKGDFEDAKAWLGMSASLKTALPYLDYHFKISGADGDVPL